VSGGSVVGFVSFASLAGVDGVVFGDNSVNRIAPFQAPIPRSKFPRASDPVHWALSGEEGS
jgi:hypothetical protein